jgi:hypothetical protein
MNTDRLLKTIQWWEKKRVWFNLCLGVVGVYTMITYSSVMSFDPIHDTIGVLVWGVLANILYSSGILLEVINLYYLKNKVNFYMLRYFLIIIGTLLYCLVTFLYAFIYYTSFW